MASPEKRSPRSDEKLVSRTYRAAVRLGEDFITLEETVTLPIDASDEEVAQAVELGWKIYRAQKAAVEAQVASVREASVAAPIAIKDPDAPASEKQRHYIGALQDDLTWTAEQLATYAREQQIDLVTMTKGQASTFIDGLKRLAEDKSEYEPRHRSEAAPVSNGTPADDGSPILDKQLRALEQLAQRQSLDLDMEARRRYGVAAHGLTTTQARVWLQELQRR